MKYQHFFFVKNRKQEQKQTFTTLTNYWKAVHNNIEWMMINSLFLIFHLNFFIPEAETATAVVVVVVVGGHFRSKWMVECKNTNEQKMYNEKLPKNDNIFYCANFIYFLLFLSRFLFIFYVIVRIFHKIGTNLIWHQWQLLFFIFSYDNNEKFSSFVVILIKTNYGNVFAIKKKKEKSFT